MNGFKYSDEEMNINKVLKMNQDMSSALLNNQTLANSRKQADNNVAASIDLLKSLGKDKQIQSLSDEISQKNYYSKLEHRPESEEWESILAQANKYEPHPILLEDIMTESEIQSAFQELNIINKEFSGKTGIVNKTDLSFLAIATVLQVAKALIFPHIAERFDYGNSFDPENRLAHDDKSIKRTHREANDKFRDKHTKNHEPGHWINILYQTVPYDITKGSKNIGFNMGGKYHRLYTLGHDPILGWIFGTANILTDCITFNTFQNYRISRKDPITGAKNMKITSDIVPLGTMFRECYEEIQANFLNLPAAIFAQAQHLKSDEFTKLGLPVPILSSIDENFANRLYSENYDALCFGRDVKIIGTSFFISKLIDIIIVLTHAIFRRNDEPKDLYEVRTRKILLISDSIASTSTIINTAITNNPKKLDIGSLLNTLSHLFFDIRFIAKIKQEFIDSEISTSVKEKLDEVDFLYENI